MFLGFLNSIGDKIIKMFSSFYKILELSIVCFTYIFNPKSYDKKTRDLLTREIYNTSVGALALFIFMAIFFGTLFVGAIIYLKTNYALGGEIGSLIVTFAIKEFAPLFTILIIAFRSSIAVNVNIALMSINRKLNTQERYGFEFMKVVFIPRVLNGVISSVLLSSVFCLIMIFGGYVFALLYMSIDFDTYKDLLIGSIGFNDLAVLILKSMAFGFFSMLIPIYSALSVKTFEELPRLLLSSMFGIFIAVFFIEVVSLLVGSI